MLAGLDGALDHFVGRAAGVGVLVLVNRWVVSGAIVRDHVACTHGVGTAGAAGVLRVVTLGG